MTRLLTIEALQESITLIKSSSRELYARVQDALIASAFFAFKDGNTTPFNQVITAVGNGAHIKGITLWIELVAGIGRVNKGVIVLNKKVREESGVIDAASFEPFALEMEKVKWHEVAGKQHAASVFDEGVYMKGVFNRLTKNGYAGLATHLKQAELGYLVQQAAERRAREEREQGEPQPQPQA